MTGMNVPEKIAKVVSELGAADLQQLVWRFMLGVAVGELRKLGSSKADVGNMVAEALLAVDQYEAEARASGKPS